MPKITSIKGRVLYNSRGSKTIEIDVINNEKFLGRVCAPSGASVGKYEAVSFPDKKPEQSLELLNKNSEKFLGSDPTDLKLIHDIVKTIDDSENYSKIGGACAFAITIAATESAAKANNVPLYKIIKQDNNFKFPLPIGNILVVALMPDQELQIFRRY